MLSPSVADFSASRATFSAKSDIRALVGKITGDQRERKIKRGRYLRLTSRFNIAARPPPESVVREFCISCGYIISILTLTKKGSRLYIPARILDGNNAQPFFRGEETDEGTERSTEEARIAEGKGENEAECADCDAFRSGAALTILLLPISTRDPLAHSLTFALPALPSLPRPFLRPDIVRPVSSPRKTGRKKQETDCFRI